MPEDPRDRHARAVALMGDDVEVVGDLRMVGQHRRLGVEVEAEPGRGAEPVAASGNPAGAGGEARSVVMRTKRTAAGARAGMLAAMRPLPAPFDAIAAGRPAADRARRSGAPREPAADQGPRLQRGRARRVPPARAAAGPGADDRRAGRARARAPPAQGRPARALHRPGRAPGPERDALLPAPRRAPGRVPADRLHADRRARLRGVQPHRPADARDLDHPGRPSTGSRSSCARARTRTSGSSSSPTTSGSWASATRAPAAWPSRSASSRCTRRRAASIRR